ncbi:acyltransferase [Carboxylicivirga taeanensis]|uniref:acyltransferase n=1 Tax=Carboxylicivirga taeanensis TaxID=1416875 RepID=UPI003F6E2A5C
MNWTIINKIRRFRRIGLFKTIFLNFHKLPFKQAIRLPILVTRNTYFYDLSGKIIINAPVKPFMIRIGYFGEDTCAWKDGRALLKVRGTLIFKGNSHYGIGVSIRVEPNSKLVIGDNVRISNNTKIICYEDIEIGNNCRIAWECQIIDTTFHYIKNINTDEISILNAPIKIGNNNWLGNRSNIMKGTNTPDFCIIAGGSLCNQHYDIPNYSMIAGVPAKLKKTGICRVLDAEEAEINHKLRS